MAMNKCRDYDWFPRLPPFWDRLSEAGEACERENATERMGGREGGGKNQLLIPPLPDHFLLLDH